MNSLLCRKTFLNCLLPFACQIKLAAVLPECMANKTNKLCDFVLCSLNASLPRNVKRYYRHNVELSSSKQFGEKLPGNRKCNWSAKHLFILEADIITLIKLVSKLNRTPLSRKSPGDRHAGGSQTEEGAP